MARASRARLPSWMLEIGAWTMANRSDGVDCAPAPLAAPRAIGRALRSILSRLAEWRERSEQRTHLASMNDRMLKDIGVSRSDAVREARKPFWQA
jgi:uncharacterized protein YjiS (DUF1127 family)